MSDRRRWSALSGLLRAVLAVSAVAITAGESALERNLAECSTSRTALIDRMITAALVFSVLAVVAGTIALITRSAHTVWASVGIVLAVAAAAIALGGYECFTITP
jgi:hypothetical protein